MTDWLTYLPLWALWAVSDWCRYFLSLNMTAVKYSEKLPQNTYTTSVAHWLDRLCLAHRVRIAAWTVTCCIDKSWWEDCILYRINCFISYVPNISYSLIYHTLPIGSKPLQGLYIRLYASSGGWFSPFLRDILNLASAECLKCLKFKVILLYLYHLFILYYTVLNQLKLPFKFISSYDIKQLIR